MLLFDYCTLEILSLTYLLTYFGGFRVLQYGEIQERGLKVQLSSSCAFVILL